MTLQIIGLKSRLIFGGIFMSCVKLVSEMNATLDTT